MFTLPRRSPRLAARYATQPYAVARERVRFTLGNYVQSIWFTAEPIKREKQILALCAFLLTEPHIPRHMEENTQLLPGLKKRLGGFAAETTSQKLREGCLAVLERFC